MNIPSENTTDIIVYGMNMANQMQLPQSNIEDEIKLSIQSFFGIGSNIYGFIICEGVCCAMKRNKKSIVNIK